MPISTEKPFVNENGQTLFLVYQQDDDVTKKVPATIIAGKNSNELVQPRAVDPAIDEMGLPIREIPRVGPEYSGSSASATTAVVTVPVNGAASVGVEITFTGTVSAKVNFEVSNDGTRWDPVALERGLDGIGTTFTSVQGFFSGNIPNCEFFRVYNRALSAGTVNATVRVGYHTHVPIVRTPITPIVPVATDDDWDQITITQVAAGEVTLGAATRGCEQRLVCIVGTMDSLGTVQFTDGTDNLSGPMKLNQLSGMLGSPAPRGNEYLRTNDVNRPLKIVTSAPFNGFAKIRTMPKTGLKAPRLIRGQGYYPSVNFNFGTSIGVGDYGRIDNITRLGYHFFPKYVYNGGTLDHLNDEIERYQSFNTTTHAFTANSLKLHAEAMNSAGTGLAKSGMLRSKWVGKYGYFECCMKVPKGSGVWPAFWMNPQDSLWPPEIDWVEIVDNTDSSTDWTGRSFHGLIHGYLDGTTTTIERPSYSRLNQFFAYEPGGGVDYHDDFHVFGGLWTPREVIHVVDDEVVRVNPHLWRHNDGTDAGCAHFIVNLALGGGWAGTPNPATLPCDLEIKYLRVWQLPGSEATYTAI